MTGLHELNSTTLGLNMNKKKELLQLGGKQRKQVGIIWTCGYEWLHPGAEEVAETMIERTSEIRKMGLKNFTNERGATNQDQDATEEMVLAYIRAERMKEPEESREDKVG